MLILQKLVAKVTLYVTRDLCTGDPFERVSMGWWFLRLSAKILALLRLSDNFFQLRLTKKFKNNLFCFS